MTLSPDDTQPRSPFETPPAQPAVIIDPEAPELPRGGPGCLTWGLVGVAAMGFALVIMALAGLAGWTSGTRTAQANGTATQSFNINDQLNHIPGDVNSRNTVLLAARIQYLATLTPGVPGLNDIMGTATAVYLSIQPTAEPTATATQPIIETEEAPVEQQALPTQSAGGFDLAALLTEAQQSISLRDWDNAIDTLDVIVSADPDFQTEAVRSLLSQAMVEKANQLLLSPDLADVAEGVILTDRAREFGNVDKVNYEAYIASLYLEGISAIGINYPLAIQKLSEVYNQVPSYRDVAQKLFNQYVAYGDAWVNQSEHCPAAGQYQTALTILNDATVSGKLSAAQAACAQATPVGAPPGIEGTPQEIAPVGVG
jgi:tetratricopeptide (TPR) repeat protein